MESIKWETVLNNKISLKAMLNTLPSKGNLVYEYNPLRNYRLTENKYQYKDNLYNLEQLDREHKLFLYYEDEEKTIQKWDSSKPNPVGWATYDNKGNYIKSTESPELFEKGQLVDFITDNLKLSLDNPVHIIPQYSYDGSVNLIINDGLNIPRLINTRFSATGRNTYEIVDRKGSGDTNIYDEGEQFDIDTSLYKIVNDIPKVTFLGTPSGGNMRVGNYHFYFKLADSDGNESDFVAESGLVSIFIGQGSYKSVHTGNKNENSTKQIEFKLDNIDSAYDYICVYYSRYTAENNDNAVYEYKKIDKKYSRTSPKLVITGFEETIDITVSDINLQYNIVDAVQTSAVCQNMLFMGNVKKQSIPYEELQDLSLRILPFLGIQKYEPELDQNYNCTNPKESYIDPKFIYENTGYWKEELYRFGIVYILPNGQLTPVFNVRGGIGIGSIQYQENKEYGFSDIPIKTDDGERRFIQYNENTFLIAEKSNESPISSVQDNNNYVYDTNTKNVTTVLYENVKGVCSFIPQIKSSDNEIYYVKFYMSKELRDELRNYVKGFFFVRQTRIPSILAQGITIGIDQESRTPTIPTAGGILSKLSDKLDKTHVETENINGVNYISEGFLKRYTFRFKKKSSGLWGSIGKIMGVAALVVGVAAVGLYSGGAGFMFAGKFGGLITSIGGLIGGSASIAAITVGAAAAAAAGVAAGVVTTAVAATQELGQAVSRIGTKKRLNGKNTKAPSGYKIVEEGESRKLTDVFDDRIIIKDRTKNNIEAIICPDYTVNQAYYNQIFTGNKHLIKTDTRQSDVVEADYNDSYFTNKFRHFYINNYTNVPVQSSTTVKVIGVPDNVKCVGIDETLFKARAGEAEEAWRYLYVSNDLTKEDEETKRINTDIIRGSYSPYLAFLNNTIGPARIVNIYAPGYDETQLQDYIEVRMNDNSTYSAITDRYTLADTDYGLKNDNSTIGYIYKAYRGDCYICQYTQRIIRNFNDPSAPYNEQFVDVDTWKENYTPSNAEKFAEINLGDVNAVPLGMWVTFQLRSSNNLNIRTLDGSNVDETAMTGHPRGYFPIQPMSTDGSYKKPESQIYNKGFAKSVSDRWNIQMPDVPHIKNWFGTRIMYSDIHINDGYKNGFRIFKGTNYRDYTREYGEIIKLVSFESSLLCIFEHGIALIPVNERAVAGQGAGGNVYINTSNVLPENPKIISDMFGSQWPESILKVPGRTGDAPQYVYGVDTVAKKIWRTDGTSIECISDLKVQEFLNNNITLGERELTPKIGIRNVKTHYNAYKRDVMFTFYDNTYGFEEKVWNLCWNELLQRFVTFYSWIPSYMENINNIPFSFNRDTSKWLAKLGTSHAESSFADGVTLTNVIIEDSFRENGAAVNNMSVPVQYLTKDGKWKTLYANASDVPKFIAGLSLSNRILPDAQVHYRVDFSLERDSWNNYKLFKIVPLTTTYTDPDTGISNTTTDGFTLPSDAMFPGAFMPLYALCFNDGRDEYQPIYYKDGEEFTEVLDVNRDFIYTYKSLYAPDALFSELYYRNSAGNAYADYDTHKQGTTSLGITYLPMDLGATFQEEDMDLITSSTGMSYEDAKEAYEGESKSWIKDENTLELFQLIYPPETIIGNTSDIYNKDNLPDNVFPCTTVGEIREILYYAADGTPMVHGIKLSQHWIVGEAVTTSDRKVWYHLPIFKDITGKRPMLPKEQQVNPDKLVTLLNIKATISIVDNDNKILSNIYYDNKAKYAKGSSLINSGYYESTVAITPRWNLQFLSTDFWKHGQAGLIDIADDVYPTYWYGKQHPFEFEIVVVNDPSVHKIFQNLELVSNKAKPESFHYEIIGESYDFAKDKVNMYFRQEAIKSIWQYNGADIVYDRNYLKVQPRQQAKSADLPHKYYTRQDTVNDVEDYYISVTYPTGYDYRHLSGAEIVYYPTRQEYRIWNHVKAINLDDLSQDDSRSIIAANCQYLEDRWKITINPILVCYKNEYQRKFSGPLIQPQNSSWTNPSRPKLPVINSPIPDKAYYTILNNNGEIELPEELVNLGYSSKDIDTSNWLNDIGIYKTNFGEAQNRKEIDLKDKFIKIRIRYSGEELAIIDFLNTIYKVSYA